MITRIVRMEFKQECLPQFHQIFQQHYQLIRHAPGCLHLELHQDTLQHHVRYTLSVWESEAALNQYRNSELFKSIWPKTKRLFAGKPQAYSLHKLEITKTNS